MIIGFDIDGVICSIDRAMLAVINNWSFDKKGRDQIEHFYYHNLTIRLNPMLFTSEGDTVILITGRNRGFEEITKSWLKRWNIKYDKLIMTSNTKPHNLIGASLDDWNNHHATLKAKVIKNNNVEVYFEDNSKVVKQLRELCPDTKIIQYGKEVAW